MPVRGRVRRAAPTTAVITALACAAALATAPTSAATPAGHAPVRFTPGAAGAGDPYFPDMGNGGYDARHYDIDLAFDPSTHAISATTTVTARATQNLSRFDLDFQGPLTIHGLTVDGHAAAFRRTGTQELVITPPHGLRRGCTFTVRVSYSGVPKKIDDPALGISGWVATKDGAVALNQPIGAATYYPVNDTPHDKATYRQTITVPTGLTVLANGDPGPVTHHGRTTTFRWQMNQPMASELASIAIGHYRITTGRTGRTPVITGIDDALERSGSANTDRLFNDTTAKIVAWESSMYGRYPFSSTGGLIADIGVDYALEVQSRPVYDQSSSTVDGDLLSHELGHQWYGDSLTPYHWSDIWLNEGFATYSEYLYQQKFNGIPVETSAKKAYDGEKDWSGKVADPGRDHIFDDLVYTRGSLTLQALRLTIGDKAFFHVLRAWADDHRYQNVTTREFVRFVERLTHRNLDPFFTAWLYSPGKPPWPSASASAGS